MLKKTKLTLIKSERKESSEETKIFQKKKMLKKRLSENDLLQTRRLNQCQYSEFGPH